MPDGGCFALIREGVAGLHRGSDERLSGAFFEENPGSELRYAAKTRDVYAHGYFTLSFSTVYRTAVEDYPRVKAWILEKLGAGPSPAGCP